MSVPGRVGALSALVLLTACSSTPADAPGGQQRPSSATAPSTSTSSSPSSSTAADARTIPEPVRGRWARVESADTQPSAAACQFGPDTAGRLIEIDQEKVSFFETQAILQEVLERDASRIHARFEEQVGDTVASRELVLDAQDDGQNLVTRQSGPDADPGPTLYRRCATEEPPEEAACPAAVPEGLGLDPFYDQYCDVQGIPLLAHEVVDPAAMRVAVGYLGQMLAHRQDVAEQLAKSPIRVGIIGRDQDTTDLPEWSDLDEAFPGTDWDQRTRGLGATSERPLVGAGEENLLCLQQDRYRGESIFVHELSHTVLQFGVQPVDPQFADRLSTAYDEAMAAGRWQDTYAARNVDEYWAEAVQSFYDTNLSDDAEHNDVDTREELRVYDPTLYELVAEVFGESDWRPEC